MSTATNYTLEITVIHRRPRTRRTIQVPSDTKLPGVHTIIQRATGAPESLQRFFIDSQRRIFGHPTWKDFRRIKSDSRVRLDRLLHERGEMLRYFSGDGEDWEHSIKLLKIERSIRRLKRATDVAGNRSIHATRERA